MVTTEAETPVPRTPSIARSTATMSALTTLSRVTGYLRIFALAVVLGTTRIADSYNIANNMPNMLYELFAGGISSALFIPIFIEYFAAKREDEAWEVASIILNFTFLGMVIVAVFAAVFAFPLVRLQTLTVKARDAQLATFFFRFFAWQVIFYGFCAIFTGLLNSFRRFAAPMISPLINNIFVVGVIFGLYLPFRNTNPRFALTALALGTTLGVVIMAAVQVPSLLRVNPRFRWTLNWRHPAIRKLIVLAVPVTGYVVSNMVGLTVQQNLAFRYAGGVAAWTYAWTFFQLPYGIFAVSIATAIFPELSEQWTMGDTDAFKRSISLGLRMTAFIILPCAAALFALSAPILGVAIQYGLFGPKATQLTAPILSFMVLGLTSFAVYMFLTKAFYSIQDTMTPMKTNALGVPLNIILNLVFVGFLGVKGLALGMAITYTFTSSALLVLLRRRIGPLAGRQLLTSFGRQVLAAVIMALVAFGVAGLVGGLGLAGKLSYVAQLLAGGAAGVAAYLGISYALGSQEVRAVLRRAKGTLSPGRPRV